MNIKETGIIVALIGSFTSITGAILLMDKALIVCGNLLMITGIALLMRSEVFKLLNPDKIQGTIIFGVGILFLLYGFMLFGLILETIGLVLILKDNIPTLRSIMKNLLFAKFWREKKK